MSVAQSPSVGKPYGVTRVCLAWAIPRSTFYDWRSSKAPSLKRGPKTDLGDEELLCAIQDVLQESEEKLGFRGEGHRKVWARLRLRGVRTSKRRVLRLMGEAELLAPHRSGSPRGPRSHDGTIVTNEPDVMWGTDATMTWTLDEGQVWVFVAIDHCTGECMGVHASKSGTRYEALEPVYEGIRQSFGNLDAGVAEGLSLRHDHGSQYMSRHFQKEIEYLGIASSPSFVRAPEGNGISERFIRTVKEQVLWVDTYRTADELRDALQGFRVTYNASWLLGRHGHRTPSEMRREHQQSAQAA